jgi:hypothetical protein
MKHDEKKDRRFKRSLAKVRPLAKASWEKFMRVAILLSVWLIEVCAFVLLPLVIYVVTFLSIGRSVREALNSPEVMFLAIILYGDVLKRQVLFYRRYRGFALKFSRELAVCVLGMTISSVLLCFSLIEDTKVLSMSRSYRVLKLSAFGSALVLSAFEKVSTGLLRGEPDIYFTLEERSQVVADEAG